MMNDAIHENYDLGLQFGVLLDEEIRLDYFENGEYDPVGQEEEEEAKNECDLHFKVCGLGNRKYVVDVQVSLIEVILPKCFEKLHADLVLV